MFDAEFTHPSLVETFWDVYFENRFVVLDRSEEGCAGLARVQLQGGPATLSRPLQLREIACPRVLMSAYDTVADGRFALLPWQPPEAHDALQAMIERRYPYRDPAPFGKERMATLLLHCQRLLGGEPDTAALQELLVRLVAGNDSALDAQIAALAFLLGELRDPSSATALLSVLRNASGMPFARRVVHFRAVSAAFSAAWKCDAKAIAPDLLVLMKDADTSARQKIAALFERLYSSQALVSLVRHGPEWLTPEFWQERLAPWRNSERWPALGAASLFWELRLSTVSRLGERHADLLWLLSADEVGVVRNAAKAQLDVLMGPGQRK